MKSIKVSRLNEYSKKCQVLRQIMSNKAHLFKVINSIQNSATVIVSAFLLFIGFSGLDKIHTYFNWFISIEKLQVEFIFNLSVFVMFVLATLHLVFHFGKRQADAERAIVILTNLINQIDDLILNENQSGSFSNIDNEVDLIRHKYETVIQTIPSNSDKEFIKAKKDFKEKEIKHSFPIISGKGIFNEAQRQDTLRKIILNSSETMLLLEEIKSVDERLYLGGGIIRNLVWDYLHGFKKATHYDDIDVIYFDILNCSKQHDKELEKKLLDLHPNLNWSVKNQARMHLTNNESQYSSIEDAVSKWPETATAALARLDSSGSLEIITPHELSDLFRLIVRPTPHFKNNTDRVLERSQNKEWLKNWPKLELII